MAQVVDSLVLYNQKHGCWWFDDERSKGWVWMWVWVWGVGESVLAHAIEGYFTGRAQNFNNFTKKNSILTVTSCSGQWNSSLFTSDSIPRHISVSTLFELLSSCLFGAKPSPKQYWSIVNLPHKNRLHWMLKQNFIFSIKCLWKCRPQNVGHFVQPLMC